MSTILQISWFALLLSIIALCVAKRNWDYEPISVGTTTADESKLSIQFKVDRVSRGVYAFTGTVDWKYDVSEGTMIEITAYRSPSGNEADYTLVPWSIPLQPFYEFLNTHYKDVFIPNFGNCSNMPVFEDKFEPPWEKKVYTFNRCEVEGEGFPEIAPEGYYKIIANFSGEVDWSIYLICRVFTAMF